MLRVVRVLLATVTGLAVAACAPTPNGSAGRTPTPAPPSASVNPGKPAQADPPLAFDRDGVSLGEPAGGQFAVWDQTAYYMREASGSEVPSLVAADLTGGKPRWSKPIATDFMSAKWTPLHVVAVDGKPRVLVSYLARLKGSGTQADRELLRVVAVDAADGTRLWTIDIDDDRMPAGPQTRLSTFTPPAMVAATSDQIVLGTDDSVIVLDTRTGNQRWAATGFRPSALEGGMVVGATVSGSHLVATRNAVDGKEGWTNADPFDRVEALGGGLVTVIGVTQTRLLDAKTGAVKVTLPGGHSCAFDADALVVCWNLGDHVAGVEVSNGKVLWELSSASADRIVPRITGVRRGVIYAVAGGNGPVILDARTGKDKVTAVTVAPTRVVPGYGLIVSERGGLFAYKATG